MKRGGQVVASMLNNWDAVTKAMDNMANSAGSADEEMSIIEQSLEYKINALKETWVGVAQDLIDRGTVGNIVDFLTTVSELLGGITKNLGLVKTAAIAAMSVLGAKKAQIFNFNSPKSINGKKAIQQGGTQAFAAYLNNSNLNDVYQQYGSLDALEKRWSFTNVNQDFKNWVDQVQAGEIEINKAKSLSQNFIEQNMSGFQKLGSKVAAFGKTLLSSLANAALSGAITWLITSIGGAAIKAWDNWVHRVENAKKAINESIDTYEQSTSELEQMNKELETSNTRIDELLGKDSLTLVEQEELDKLKESNEELERQIRLKERENDLDARHMAEDIADNYWATHNEVEDSKEHGFTMHQALYSSDGNGYADVHSEETWTNDAQEFTQALREEQEELERVNSLLHGMSLEKDKLNDGKIELIGGDEKAVEELEAEFGSLETLYYYRNQLQNNISSMTKDHEDLLYDLEGYMLEEETWLDKLDKVGYDNLNTKQREAYDQLKADIEYLRSQVYNDSEQFTIKLKAEIDDKSVQENMAKIQRKITDSGLWDSLSKDQKESINNWILGLTAEEAQGVADNIDELITHIFQQTFYTLNTNDYIKALETYLSNLGKGGTVDLTNRPQIDTSELAKAGWEDVGEGYATLYSSTFANEAETIAINFTPIMVDENGNYIGTLSPQELEDYAMGVINGTRTDDKKLQIGVAFTGDNAIERASDAAVVIHNLHELLYEPHDPSKQGFFTSINLFTRLKEAAADAEPKVYKVKHAVDELNDSIKASSAVDSMADAKTALNSLDELYAQTVTKTAKDGQATGFADPALLNSVESSFSKFVKELEDSGNKAGATELNDALENFEDTMVRFPNDEKKAQDAMDDLVTAYIDQTDIIKNLTKENKEWSIAQLKAMGVTNAQEVVETRLTKQNKQLSESYSKITEAINRYNTALANGNEADQQNAISGVTSELNGLYKAKNNAGQEIQLFDEQTVLANLDTINAALDDTSGKFNELDRLAARQYIMKMRADIDDANVDAMWQYLDNCIATFDGQSIDIGTSMDGTPIFMALEAIRHQTKMTMEEFKEMVSAMSGGTIQAKTSYEYVETGATMEIPDYTSVANGKSLTPKMQTVKLRHRVPKFTYEYVGKGSRGSRANYTPTTSNNTNSGSPSGDNSKSSEPNKPKEEAAETFDWIEVKLKRLEEAQQRLDKVVNNGYESWSTRNKKLTQELSNIEKQIKNNELAEKHYKKEAKKVQINDGKAPKREDYGENDQLVYEADKNAYLEAVEIWKSDKYQKLIQKGKIGKDDIEKINNQYLVKAIQEYTQWWEKGIAAGDKAEDKAIEHANLLKKRFDMIKTEYEQLISLIQDRADVINAKIERTQAKGFFVSNDYYKQLIANENKQLARMEQEREKLIKARNAGMVENGWTIASAEYRNMTHDINALTTSIEQAKNQTIEWQNAMRQNNWDKFDWMEQRIERIKTEAQGLIDLMSNDKLYEDDGRLTDKGMASLGMIAVQYQTNERQIAHYRSELKKLSDQIKGDPSNKDLIARYDELADKTNELVSSNEQLKDSWKSMVETGIQTHLSNLDKIISKYQEVVDAEKETYDYQKNISKQVKNINELERMLTIYSGDDSEESRKNRQQLQTQLEDAREALQETEWDKAINESKKLVSQMREDYEEFLNKRLDDIDALMEYGIGEAKKNTDAIVETLKAEADKTGFVITPELQDVFDHTEDTNLLGATNAAVVDIKDYVKKMADKEDMDSYQNFKSEAEKRNETRWNTVNTVMSKMEATIQERDNAKTEKGAAAKQATIDKQQTTALGQLDTLENSYLVQLGKLEKLQKSGADVDWEIKQVQKMLDEVYNTRAYIKNLMNSGTFMGVKAGYAKGSRRIPHDQLAWTQEEGQELIFRSSDGAMLTPLGSGD